MAASTVAGGHDGGGGDVWAAGEVEIVSEYFRVPLRCEMDCREGFFAQGEGPFHIEFQIRRTSSCVEFNELDFVDASLLMTCDTAAYLFHSLECQLRIQFLTQYQFETQLYNGTASASDRKDCEGGVIEGGLIEER